MQMQDYQQLVRAMTVPNRYWHSLCVCQKAQQLAQRYQVPVHKAAIAGLLHDIYKNQPDWLQLQRIEKSGIMLDSIQRTQKQLWHGIAGAAFLRDALNITDSAILNAVRYHTSGRAGMSALEQVVYLADLTSIDRQYPDVERMRQLADLSLAGAMREALQFIVADLHQKGEPVNADTLGAYRQFCG